MRVALINPRPLNNVYHFFPIGLGYIAASMEHNKFEYDFIDMALENWTVKQLIAFLKKAPPYDCFAITGLISSFMSVKDICYSLRGLFPSTPIVLGGKISKVNPEMLFSKIGPSFIIDGEGEESFPMLIKKLSGSWISVEDIPGLIYRDSEGNIRRNQSSKVKEIDKYRIPYEKLPMNRYVSRFGLTSNGLKSINMISSRGCPFQCTFCNFSDGISGKPLRLYPLDKMEREIAYLKKFNLEHIFFNDDVFAMNTGRLREMGYMLHRLGIKYSISMRLDVIDEEKIQILEETGCKVLQVGVESASTKILGIIDKCLDLKHYQKNIELCQKSKMVSSFNFIAGYFGETEETLNETYQFILQNKILYTSFFATAYPGTKLYEMVKVKINNEEDYLYKLSVADLQTDYILNISDLPEEKLKKVRNNMIIKSALNCLTPNKNVQLMAYPLFIIYWWFIKANRGRVRWLKRSTDLINWVIIKPIFSFREKQK